MTHRLTCLLASLLFLFTGCDKAPPSPLPTTQIKVGSRTYTLEIARTIPERDKGLMQRDSMPADHGMIFLFATAHEQSFWMKNTRIPLDIVYLDAAGKVVSVHRMEPYKLDTVPSNGDAKYAIELNADQANSSGVKPGDSVPIPDSIKSLQADP